MPNRRNPLVAAMLLALTGTAIGAADPKPLAFDVTYDAKIHPGPLNARVYVMLAPATGRDPRFGPNWFAPQPFFAVDAKDWKPGEPLHIGADAAGYPGPLTELKPGSYRAQAVVRLNPDTHSIGDGEGNAFGPIVSAELDPMVGGTTALTVDQVVPPKPFRESERVKLVEIESPLLTKFHKRPIRHRAGVVLPEGYTPDKKYPTVYIIPGFGGDHHSAAMYARGGRRDFGASMIRVILDPDCGTGHHVFADSAFNGPRGEALISELIPFIEKTFAADPRPALRFVNGHSSGGWSSLWLQIAYPEAFGGVWSTSPDPVDFRDFQRVDLYAADANLFRDEEGKPRPIARRGTTPVLFTEPFSRMEGVVGDGGQLHSFEAVFSPPTPDGRPRPLMDRKTGAVDAETAKAWEKYDIRLKLEREWPTLGPKLAGKLHIYTGEIDTFYLEGAVAKLKESLAKLGSDAVIEIIPGKDHSNILDADLAKRLDRELEDAVTKAK